MIIKTITIILAVLSFFYPLYGSWSFVMFISFLNAIIITLSYKKINFNSSPLEKFEFTTEQIKVIKKYYLYFRYPLTSKSLSSSFSLINIISFILFFWFSYNKLWLPIIILIIAYYFTYKNAWKLNPRFYLHDANKNGTNLAVHTQSIGECPLLV